MLLAVSEEEANFFFRSIIEQLLDSVFGISKIIKVLIRVTLFFFYKNVVFPAQAEYSYFSVDFRLKIFLYYS